MLPYSLENLIRLPGVFVSISFWARVQIFVVAAGISFVAVVLVFVLLRVAVLCAFCSTGSECVSYTKNGSPRIANLHGYVIRNTLHFL
jgi:hypothetical protein